MYIYNIRALYAIQKCVGARGGGGDQMHAQCYAKKKTTQLIDKRAHGSNSSMK